MNIVSKALSYRLDELLAVTTIDSITSNIMSALKHYAVTNHVPFKFKYLGQGLFNIVVQSKHVIRIAKVVTEDSIEYCKSVQKVLKTCKNNGFLTPIAFKHSSKFSYWIVPKLRQIKTVNYDKYVDCIKRVITFLSDTEYAFTDFKYDNIMQDESGTYLVSDIDLEHLRIHAGTIRNRNSVLKDRLVLNKKVVDVDYVINNIVPLYKTANKRHLVTCLMARLFLIRCKMDSKTKHGELSIRLGQRIINQLLNMKSMNPDDVCSFS